MAMTTTTTTTPSEVVTWSICVQKVRFIVYASFWAMVSVAITVTKIYVVPYLAEGPADGSTCAPFSRNLPDLGVVPGVGWDFYTQSDLQERFGFRNVCTNWDYSPAREVTASVYPVFEYAALVFIIMEHLVVLLSRQKGDVCDQGEVRPWFCTVSWILLPIKLVLTSQFRMIFVFLAYENVEMHTMGFLGFQICLMLIALQSVGYIIEADVEYESCRHHTKLLAKAFIIGDLIIFAFKVTATFYVVTHGKGAPWTMKDSPISGMKVGQIVDLVWMIFNAMAPLGLAYLRMGFDRHLEFTVKFKPKSVHEVDTETQPLTVPNYGSNTEN
mmetsp:Transcript_28706/g.34080  ORF Transcript_28706/g.34080 Transcript_28706/m.34080 type:complete len:328 (+) Transcript_28706:57-1040(+)